MAWILTKIFYGSSYVGFEVMDQIDPIFGPPLMIIFVTLSSFLLIGSLTGMLSNSFSRVIGHSKEEYLYVYSVYVLEASTSNRLTHFYPPFNLLAFVIFRPWRLIFSGDEKFRAGRIILLKATHAPIVAIIKLYEMIRKTSIEDEFAGFKGPRDSGNGTGRGNGRRPQKLRDTSHYGRNDLLSPRRIDVSRTEDDVDAPSSPVEVQVAELNRKIDQLTAVIMAMQEKQEKQASEGAGTPA